jgi:hypothetical protein
MRNRPKLVTLAALLVGALLFSCGVNQLLRPTWTLTTARGTVINYELRYDPQTSMALNWVEVRFQLANGNDVLFESTPEELYKPGESVPIAYYPWDPAGTAAIGREPQGMAVVIGLQLVLIVACTIAGGGLLWAGWRALRRETTQPGKFRFRF